MDFEQWKSRRQYDGEPIISLRDMKGWKGNYFPEDLAAFFLTSFPDTELCDLYYAISESKDESYRLETVTLQMTVGDWLVDSNVHLEMDEGENSFEFTYTIDNSLEVTADTEKMLSVIYHKMKQFIEENSPQRLVLLSSHVDEWLPEWMTKG